MITFCVDCEHVEPHSRKKLPPYWLCMKFKRLEGMGFVAPNLWAEMEPFMRAVHINGGLCPLWEPRRQETLKNDSGQKLKEHMDAGYGKDSKTPKDTAAFVDGMERKS